MNVQDDRLEVEIKAYGRGKESWSVDYQVILNTVLAELWTERGAAPDWGKPFGQPRRTLAGQGDHPP